MKNNCNKMKKSFKLKQILNTNLLVIATILGLGTINLSTACIANNEIDSNEGTKIYTEQFRVNVTDTTKDINARTLFSANTQLDTNQIGSVGNLKIVNGERPKEFVAFVKKDKGLNYLIKSKILIKCKKDITCVPSTYNPIQVGNSNLYQVEAIDYNNWKQIINELKNQPGVIQTIPSIDYGFTPNLN